MFTQDNIFTAEVLQHRRPLEIEKGGNTLDQLATVVGALGVRVMTRFASELDASETRRALIAVLQAEDQRIIVDLDRKVLHQKGSGHCSPLAAYHEGEDRFLLLDMARHKLPPCWVKADTLHEAMTGIDSSSNKSRGFLVVTRLEPKASACDPACTQHRGTDRFRVDVAGRVPHHPAPSSVAPHGQCRAIR